MTSNVLQARASVVPHSGADQPGLDSCPAAIEDVSHSAVAAQEGLRPRAGPRDGPLTEGLHLALQIVLFGTEADHPRGWQHCESPVPFLPLLHGLLAYGPPVAMASLLATVSKLVAVEGTPRASYLCSVLCMAVGPPENAGLMRRTLRGEENVAAFAARLHGEGEPPGDSSSGAAGGSGGRGAATPSGASGREGGRGGAAAQVPGAAEAAAAASSAPAAVQAQYIALLAHALSCLMPQLAAVLEAGSQVRAAVRAASWSRVPVPGHERCPEVACSVALACKGPLSARLATGIGLSFFSFFQKLRAPPRGRLARRRPSHAGAP
jgi:hypothetical protein